MNFTIDYIQEVGLEKLFSRLKKGQILEGKIIDTIDPNGYLLRIRGFNIITQSNGIFKKNDKILLMVREVDSHLVLDFVPKKNNIRNASDKITDIIV